MPTEAQIAWAAGIFEGEGCWVPTRGRGARAQVAMTDRDVIDRFHAIVGMGVIYTQNRDHRGQKEIYAWTIQSAVQVRRLIELFMPYLGERRLARARQILARTDGVGEQGRSKYQTQCMRGHAYDAANTGRNSRGNRYCRTCKNARRRKPAALESMN